MDEAQDAIQGMNGRNFNGKRLKIDLAKPRNRNNNGGGGMARGGDRPRGGSRACFKCNEEGHFARECPNADNQGSNQGSYNRNDQGSRGNYGGYNNNNGNSGNNRGSYGSKNDNNRSGSRSASPKRQGNSKKRSASRSKSNSPKRNRSP
jgi:RNA recognition motif-containing protein